MSTAAQLQNSPDIGVLESAWNRLHWRIDQPLSQLEELVSVLFIRPLGEVELALALQFCEETATRLSVVGFREASALVTNVARILTRTDLGVAEGLAIASLLDEARVDVASVVSQQKCRVSSGSSVLVVGAVTETVDELIWMASVQGLAVAYAIDEHDVRFKRVVAESADSGEADRFDSIVVVLSDESAEEVRSKLSRLHQFLPSVPLLAVIAKPGSAQGVQREDNALVRCRIAAAESASTVIDRALVTPSEIIEEICRSVAHSLRPQTVSVFGGGSDWLAGRLASRGLTANAEHNLTALLESLASSDLRAVVLTPHQAAMNSGNKARLSVLRLIRTDPKLRSTIVAVIDVRPDAVRRRDALRQGADIYVGPDIDLDDLAVMLRTRLERQGDAGGTGGRASETGHSLTTSPTPIEHLIEESKRLEQACAVAIVRSTKLERSTSQVLDRQMASMLRDDSILMRVDQEHLVIAVRGIGSDQLCRRMSTMHDELSLDEFEVLVACLDGDSTGTEQSPEPATRDSERSITKQSVALDRILVHGTRLLDQMDTQTGIPVATVLETETISNQCDVFVIDPDPTIGAMLLATLERRGLRVKHETDGLEALNLLSGSGNRLRPKVILMDLALREVDGLQFLRLLFEAGVSESVKVIVLSAQMDESSLRLAFELGIDDFVLKPFSAPLLVHRVMRALSR